MLKSVGVYFAANLMNAFIPLMLLPVLTRFLTVSEYGEVAIFIAMVGFFSAIVGTTFVGAVGRKFFDVDINAREYAGYVAAAISLGVLGALLTLLVLMLYDEIAASWLKISKIYIYFALAVAFFGFIIQLKLNQYQIRKLPKSYAKLQVSWTAINATFSLCAVVVLGFGSDGRIGAQLLSSFLMMFVALFYLVKANRLSFLHVERNHYRELILFGVPLLPHVLGGYILNSIDRVVIGSELDLRAAGLYAVAFQLSAAAGLAFDAINKAWQPWLFEMLNMGKNEEKLRIVKYTYLWFCLLTVGCFTASLFAQSLIVFVAGDKYAEAGDVFIWLLWAQVFKGMYCAVVNYCFYVKRTGWLSLSSVLAGCIHLALLFSLVYKFGLIGAGYAYVISMAIRFILTWSLSIKMYKMPWLFFLVRK